jgi:predicted RNA-binding protein with PIN domain
MSSGSLVPALRRRHAPGSGRASFGLGVLWSAAVMGGFVAFGLGVALLERTARATPYPSGMPAATEDEERTGAAPEVWLVDGYNVLHAGVLRGRDRAGWWKAAAQARLVAAVAGFDDPQAELWVIFDAARPEAASERCSAPPGSRVRLVFTPSADDWIVRRVRGHAEPGRLAVVTADRQVAERARQRGARVVSPLAFLRRCADTTGSSSQSPEAPPDA